MHCHELVRNVRSNDQVRCSSGASNETYSCRSAGGGAGVSVGGEAIGATLAHARCPVDDLPCLVAATAHRAGDREERPVAGEFDDIRHRLEAIGEELADLAI